MIDITETMINLDDGRTYRVCMSRSVDLWITVNVRAPQGWSLRFALRTPYAGIYHRLPVELLIPLLEVTGFINPEIDRRLTPSEPRRRGPVVLSNPLLDALLVQFRQFEAEIKADIRD